MNKQDYLNDVVHHLNIREFDATPLITAYEGMAFQARNLSRAAKIYDRMLADKDCTVILTLAGSMVSAGLKMAVVDMLENNMVDAIVSTGANIVDQDFFEALGFKHYQGRPDADDNTLRELGIDRIYDTYIDEEQLRICDNTIAEIAEQLPRRAYSSRQFIQVMGKFLQDRNQGKASITRTAFERGVPIFVPAFSDCSAGFGLVCHQMQHREAPVTIDSVQDFRELTDIKVRSDGTGLLMLGGGVPKNFAQDIVVAAELLGHETAMHKYAIQLTVADERDGALSGSTLKEACSWGKVDTTYEQMVYGEYTLTFPLLASYGYHQRSWEKRQSKDWNSVLDRI